MTSHQVDVQLSRTVANWCLSFSPSDWCWNLTFTLQQNFNQPTLNRRVYANYFTLIMKSSMLKLDFRSYWLIFTLLGIILLCSIVGASVFFELKTTVFTLTMRNHSQNHCIFFFFLNKWWEQLKLILKGEKCCQIKKFQKLLHTFTHAYLVSVCTAYW